MSHSRVPYTSLKRAGIVGMVVLMPFLFACRGGGSDPSQGEGKRQLRTPLFDRLSSKATGIKFENTLSERPTPHRTELLYEYFSNGGGVAVGDLNGDGLDDLYFVGNMKYNKLYLNEGGMQFRDVTGVSNVRGRRNTWKTGVSMADVNGDGLLDIYVCYSGDLPLERRVDELYINQGVGETKVPRFRERAAEYGLANPHSSNQAYFFDYDRDGDLDLFLQTHNVKTLPRGNPRQQRQQRAQEDSVNGNRFYENKGGHFEDVTGQTGIKSSPLTYGLGAGISDLNKDGWPDIYVGNDYSPPDHLYINNGDGTFSDELAARVGHTSRASMGIDVADVNNDQLSDIFVLDMLSEGNERQKLLHIPNNRKVFEDNVQRGFYYQYTVNTLQVNNGNGTFSEVGQLAGVSNTDWSWAPLIADYDNDGWKDIYVTNGILHDITNRDFLQFRRNYIESKNYNLKPKDVSVLMSKLPTTHLDNYIFENRKGLTFRDVSSEWGVDDSTNSNGAVYSDLDNDGDLDLVTNNINSKSRIYENRSDDIFDRHFLKINLRGNGGNTHGVGSKVSVFTDSTTQYREQYPARGYLSSVSPTLHFGVGGHRRVDSVRVTWPDGREQILREVRANQTLTVRQNEAMKPTSTADPPSPVFREVDSPIDFRHRKEGDVDDFRRQPLMVNAKSFSGPALAKSDVNGDGLPDVFVGGGNGQTGTLYVQRPNGTFVSRSPTVFAEDKASSDVAAVFVDANADGHPDLYVASGGYDWFEADDPALQDRLYVNDGKGHFAKAADALPRMRTSTGVVTANDVNGDGYPDLFVGGRVVPGRYPEAPRSYLLVNDGEGHFDDRTSEVAPDLERKGMVTDAIWHNLDGEGAEELVVVGEWMPITVYGIQDGRLSNRTGQYFERPHRGLWNAVAATDLDGDGRSDLLAGNLGLNTQLSASRDEPAELIYDDFDRDGSVDPILSYHVDGTSRPHVLLDRLRKEVPMIGARFSTYREYSRATTRDLFTARERREASRLRVSGLETSLFLMDENHTFARSELPIESQFSPVFSVQVLDYNDDGVRDLVLTGNMNETRIRFAKYDANYGTLMRGEGDGEFEYVPQRVSGFNIRGDVRTSLRLGDTLFFGVNRGHVEAYRPTQN